MPQLNWPIEGFSIIAPIIFIILIVLFPLIGLAVGWKKAAFWGGGNFLFFLIGLLIWRFAGAAIIQPVKDLLTKFLQSIPGAESLQITDQLLVSVAAPIWFLIWMFITEIILLINYFAWYKRVVGLKKIKVIDKKTGKVTKQYAKVNTKAGTTSYKVLNRVGGVLLLGALTIPTTITFTQTIYYLTTSNATRSTKKLSNTLYSGLEKINNTFNWMTYYPQTGSDYSAIFSALSLISKKISYIDPSTGEKKELSMMEYTEQVIGAGISTMLDKLDNYASEEPTVETANNLTDTINVVSDAWNQLVNESQEDLIGVFSSQNVGDALNQIIGPIISSTQQGEGSPSGKFELSPDIYNTLFVGGGGEGEEPLFDKIVDLYNSENPTLPGATETIEKFTPIVVPESAVGNMSNLFYNFFDVSQLEGDYEQTIKNSLSDVMGLLFVTQ